MPVIIETVPPPVFEWKRWPETDAVVDQLIKAALAGNTFAGALAERMPRETGTRFGDWVDHLVVRGNREFASRLGTLGYERQPTPYAVGVPVYAHPGGIFPRIALAAAGSAAGDSAGAVLEVAIKVERVSEFSRAHDLGLDILGYPLGPYRVARVPGAQTSLAVIERRGYLGFEPFPGELARQGRMSPQAARDALAARDVWESRRRRFDDDED
jgi:hypothetical protein